MKLNETDDRVRVLFDDEIQVRLEDVAYEARRLTPDADIDTEVVTTWVREHLEEYADHIRLCMTMFATQKVAELFAEES